VSDLDRRNKSQLVRRIETGRTQLDRLLDPDNTSVTFHTLCRAAEVLGKRLRVSFEEVDHPMG